MDSQKFFFGGMTRTFKGATPLKLFPVYFLSSPLLCCFSTLPSLCKLNPFLYLKRLPSELLCSEKMFEPPVLNIAYSLQLKTSGIDLLNWETHDVWKWMKKYMDQQLSTNLFTLFPVISQKFMEIKTSIGHIFFYLSSSFIYYPIAPQEKASKEANVPRKQLLS